MVNNFIKRVSMLLSIFALFVFVGQSCGSAADVETKNINSASLDEALAEVDSIFSEDTVVKEFTITASQFAFDPATITVQEGDAVRFIVTSTDVDHGLTIAQFGVGETIPAGETKTIEFIADTAGTYTMFCSVFCGSGHGDMTGTLIVE